MAWTPFTVKSRFSSQANYKDCVCSESNSPEQAVGRSARKDNLHLHSFHTFSDFAFLALCTNLRPSFLAYQIEANIAMPMDRLTKKPLHNQLLATSLGLGDEGSWLELSLAGCCFLSSSHAGSGGRGGRREGMEGSPVWPVCRYIYILPAGGPAEAGAAFMASSHTCTRLSVCL